MAADRTNYTKAGVRAGFSAVWAADRFNAPLPAAALSFSAV